MNLFSTIYQIYYYLQFVPYLFSFIGGYFIGIRTEKTGIRRAVTFIIASLLISCICIVFNLLLYFFQIKSIFVFRNLDSIFYLALHISSQFPIYYLFSIVGGYVGVLTKRYLYSALLKNLQSNLSQSEFIVKRHKKENNKKQIVIEGIIIAVSIIGIFLMVNGLYVLSHYLQMQKYKASSNKASEIIKMDQAAFRKKLERIYVIGGYTRQGKSNTYRETNTIEYYSPQTNTWNITAPMKIPRAHSAAAYVNGKIYVFGGSRLNPADIPLNSAEAYSLQKNEWEFEAPMAVGKTQQAAAVVNGKIYLVGGITTAFKKLSTVDIYTPATNSWTTGATSPIPFATDTPNCNAIESKIYCLKVTNQGYTMVYDTESDKWASLATENRSSVNSGIGVTIGDIIVSNVFAPSHNYITIYNVRNDSYIVDIEYPVSISDYSVAAIDGYFITIGGDATKGPIKTVRVINTAYPKIWFNVSSMHESRKNLSAVVVPETSDKGAVIEGVIYKDIKGNPAPNIKVVLQTTQIYTDQHGKKREEFGNNLVSTMTDSTGKYIFLGISPGKYEVLVENPNQQGDFRIISSPSTFSQLINLSKNQHVKEYNFDISTIPSP